SQSSCTLCSSVCPRAQTHGAVYAVWRNARLSPGTSARLEAAEAGDGEGRRDDGGDEVGLLQQGAAEAEAARRQVLVHQVGHGHAEDGADLQAQAALVVRGPAHGLAHGPADGEAADDGQEDAEAGTARE